MQRSMRSKAVWERQTQGKQAAGTPLKNRVPRTPFGPSVRRIDLTFRRGIDAVCQKSTPVVGFVSSSLGQGGKYAGIPESKAIFSSIVSLDITSSTSNVNLLLSGIMYEAIL
jgi:hypothetical protein